MSEDPGFIERRRPENAKLRERWTDEHAKARLAQTLSQIEKRQDALDRKFERQEGVADLLFRLHVVRG